MFTPDWWAGRIVWFGCSGKRRVRLFSYRQNASQVTIHQIGVSLHKFNWANFASKYYQVQARITTQHSAFRHGESNKQISLFVLHCHLDWCTVWGGDHLTCLCQFGNDHFCHFVPLCAIHSNGCHFEHWRHIVQLWCCYISIEFVAKTNIKIVPSLSC